MSKEDASVRLSTFVCRQKAISGGSQVLVETILIELAKKRGRHLTALWTMDMTHHLCMMGAKLVMFLLI